MEPRQNQLFEDSPEPIAVQTETLKNPTSHYSKVSDRKTEIRKLIRKETAAEAIKGFEPGMEIFGFTKGQFSLIELIDATCDVTGPAHITVSTWTAANTDLNAAQAFLASGKLLSARFLLDFSFQRRAPGMAHSIRQQFGVDAIRVSRVHAKFVLLRNEKWSVVIRTSMNLNTNPRFEDFTISDDPAMADFLSAITDEIFQRQKIDDADRAPQWHKNEFNAI